MLMSLVKILFVHISCLRNHIVLNYITFVVCNVFFQILCLGAEVFLNNIFMVVFEKFWQVRIQLIFFVLQGEHDKLVLEIFEIVLFQATAVISTFLEEVFECLTLDKVIWHWSFYKDSWLETFNLVLNLWVLNLHGVHFSKQHIWCDVVFS